MKSINLEDNEKVYLDAVADVMCWTQHETVRNALWQMCPVPEWEKMTEDQLKIEIAKRYIQKLHREEAQRFCIKHGLDMEDMGYPSEQDIEELSD